MTEKNRAGLRQQAEDLLQTKTGPLAQIAKGDEQETESTPQKPELIRDHSLLHELRVHQIELEMQNEELRRTQLELDAQRVRYFDLYDQAPVGYITINDKGLITEANLTAANLLGMDRMALIGMPFSQFIIKDDHDSFYLKRKQLYMTTSPLAFELRMLKKQGPKFWAYLVATAVQDENGARLIRITLSDISERKHMEEELKEQSLNLEKMVQERTRELAGANQRLIEVLDKEKTIRMQLVQIEKHGAIGRMIASIAHELNNPIQTIRNCIYIIQQDIRPDSTSQEFVEMACTEIERVDTMVSQLREIYRPQPSDELKNIDLGNILKQVNSLLRSHLQHENVIWELTGITEPVFILAVPDQIKQVFINLSLNAIEAMQPQGGRILIDLTTPKNSDMARVSIQDNGPGIPAENVSRIFEPFYTTKETGMGLGLSICYDIVKKLEGDITVESKPDRGTIFSVWLPLMTSPPDETLD